ncbi:BTB and MATH domain-containing protein 36-like [Littorina saxatilis]|uniref:BTB and MATH domain-containing protein 36-like n=1 Tax=Littorina saxatilis TaxID=31220 RepID=UPI0038B55513
MAATCDDPFEADSAMADVTFLVEDKPLRFFKSLLVFSSPVFAKMFTSDFRERESKEISMPGKKYWEFVVFLKQLHPAHSWLPLTEDSVEPLLKLADEYDVQHVKTKCQHYIREQLRYILPAEQVMKYMWLCETYTLKEVDEALTTTLTADYTAEKLEECEHYAMLQMQRQLDLAKKRCKFLEDEKVNAKKVQIDTHFFMKEIHSAFRGLPPLVLLLPQKCVDHCVPCPNIGDSCSNSSYKRKSPEGFCYCKTFSVSSLQKSFCQACVLEKIAVILGSLFTTLEKFKQTEHLRNSKNVTFS